MKNTLGYVAILSTIIILSASCQSAAQKERLNFRLEVLKGSVFIQVAASIANPKYSNGRTGSNSGFNNTYTFEPTNTESPVASTFQKKIAVHEGQSWAYVRDPNESVALTISLNACDEAEIEYLLHGKFKKAIINKNSPMDYLISL